MRSIWKGLLLALGLVIGMMSVSASGDVLYFFQQDEPSTSAAVRVIPPDDFQGGTHTIFVGGLQSVEDVTIRIIQDATGNSVYSKEFSADQNGRLQVDIFTTDGDAPGTYTIQVANSDMAVIGEGTLTILPPVGRDGILTITPEKGEATETFIFSLMNIRAFADLEFSIYNGLGELIERIQVRSTVDGSAIVEYESNPRDGGQHTVEVKDSDIVIAEGVFVIDGPLIEINSSIMPEEVNAGEAVVISVTGLEPELSTLLRITYAGNTVEVLESGSDVNGSIILTYMTEPDATPGEYTVAILQDQQTLGQTSYFVRGSFITAVLIPPSITQTESAILSVAGMRANETVRVEIVQDELTLLTRDVTADVNGSGLAILEGQDLEAGDYDIRIVRDGAVVTEESLTVVQSEQPLGEVGINIDPSSGVRGTVHVVTITGLAAGETVSIEVETQGDIVYTTERTADATGIVGLNLRTESSDELGTFNVSVLRDGQAVAQGSFEVTEGIAAGEPQITIEPDSGAIGTSHLVTVTNLNAGETVTIDVIFADESVFSTTRTADANGAAEIILAAEEGDPQGQYVVVVLRGDQEILRDSFTVTGGETATEGATLTVIPTTVPEEGSFTITAEGLTAGTTYDFAVTFGSETVYSTSRTADDNGSFTIQLAADAGDPVGMYTITLSENGTELAQANFDLLGAGGAPTISIEPDTVPAEGGFVVRGSNLNTGETYDVAIVFGGEVVFSTTRTADDNGEIEVLLAANAGDPAGEYTAVISQADNNIVQNSFVLEGGEAPDTTDEVVVSIDPSSGTIGTNHVVTVTGLRAGEIVTIDVLFDGNTVYTTERVADTNGATEVILAAEEGDPAGAYTVNVVRDNAVLASSTLTVEGEIAQGVTPTPVPTEVPSQQIQPTVDTASDSQNLFVTGRLSTAQPEYRASFTGVAGESVIILLDSTTFDPYVVLEDSAGNELITNDDSNGTINAQIGPYTLPYSGTYTVTASSYGFVNFSERADGEFQLIVQPFTVQEVTYGSSTSLSITEENYAYFMTFMGNAGDIVSIAADSGGDVDTQMQIVAPTGELIAQDDDSGSGFDPEIIGQTLTRSGVYTVLVRAFSPAESGNVTLTLTQDATASDDGMYTVELDRKRTTDTITLIAQAGQMYQMTLELTDGQVSDLNILVEQGEDTLMTYNTSAIPGALLLGFVAPQDGLVTIVISDFGGSLSQLDVTIEPMN